MINEVLLAQGQAVPEWLCKSGYLEVSRTARHRLSPAKPEPVSVYLLVQPWPGWAEALPQECSDSSKASAPATTSQGKLALLQARRQPQCRTDWDSTGKETNPLCGFMSVLVSIWSLLISMLCAGNFSSMAEAIGSTQSWHCSSPHSVLVTSLLDPPATKKKQEKPAFWSYFLSPL